MPPFPVPPGQSDAADQPSGFLPVRTVRGGRLPSCWFVGCHGGAGTTTLARLIAGGADAGRYWPVPEGESTVNVVLVARSYADGLRAAQSAAGQWAMTDLRAKVQLLGLAVVADAPGRRPRVLRDLLELVSGGVPMVWDLPWVEGFRLGDPMEENSLPADYKKLTSDLADDRWVEDLRRVNAPDASP